MSDERVTFPLSEADIPTHWVNLLPDLPGEPLPPLNPGTMQPAGPDDLTPIFPMGLILQEVSAEPEVEIPEPGPRRLQALAPDAAVPRAAPRARARYAGAHLLQVRGRLAAPARTSPTPRSRRPTRTRRPAMPQARDGDRRRAVGLGARVRLLAVRAGVRGLHGRLQLRPEALPALDDGDLGRDRAPLAERPHRGRARAGRASHGLARDRDLGGGRGGGAGRDLQLRAGLGAQPRAPAPDGDRAGGDEPSSEMAGEEPDVVVACVGGGSNFGGIAFPFLRRVHPRR